MESVSINSFDSINLSGMVPDWSPSAPLLELASRHIEFLSTVFATPNLQNESVLYHAMRRYELYWLPLCKQHQDEELEPPLDIHWMWHCHMLSPVVYAKDCNAVLGFMPDHKLRARNSPEFCAAIAKTEKLWTEMFPDEPFVCDIKVKSSKDANANKSDSESYNSQLTHDLIEATKRQKSFYYQVSLGHFKDKKFLSSGLDRYIKFLFLKKSHPDLFTVPMYDIDLLWHTHQLSPVSYANDMRELLGHVLNHDDKDQDRSPTSKLAMSGTETRTSWRRMYNEPMALPGTCYRGESLADKMVKDPLRMPVALRCMLQVEKLTLSGGHQTDIIQARICSSADSSKTLLELPTVEGTPARWAPNQYIMTDQMRGQPVANVDMIPVNRSGMWGTLVGTSLPVMKLESDFYVEDKVPQRYMEFSNTEHLPRKLPLILHAKQGGYAARMSATVAGVRPAESQLMMICWGPATTKTLTPELIEELSPINLPRAALHAQKPINVTVYNHSMTMKDQVMYTVRIVTCHDPKVNVVQIFNGDKVVALSELCNSDQLPRPSQVDSKTTTITLDTQRGENGMIIKNYNGDWGIIKGCRSHTVEGSENGEALVIPGQLEASLTLLSPYRLGRFTLTERGLWQRFHLPGAAPRKFELFGSEGISVDMEACTVQLGRDCRHIAEFTAALFSVWI